MEDLVPRSPDQIIGGDSESTPRTFGSKPPVKKNVKKRILIYAVGEEDKFCSIHIKKKIT
jgi:hypothetical protein